MTLTDTPRRRADATRNRDRILTAAGAAFADPQADVSMAEIARRAGVGSATLYRNFANRRELLEALYLDEIDTVCAAAADGSLLDWVRAFYVYFSTKVHVAEELLQHTDADDPFFSTGRARVLDAGRPLLTAAQEAGELRTDLTLEQILDLVAAVAKIGGEESYREPILRATLDALQARP